MSDQTTAMDSLKKFATRVTAVTALITAITSLVKAVDKSIEQASYEVLSRKIVELQKKDDELRKALDSHLMEKDEPMPEPPPPMMLPSALPSASFKMPLPYGSATAMVGETHLPPDSPVFPPPSWNDIKSKAEKY